MGDVGSKWVMYGPRGISPLRPISATSTPGAQEPRSPDTHTIHSSIVESSHWQAVILGLARLLTLMPLPLSRPVANRGSGTE